MRLRRQRSTIALIAVAAAALFAAIASVNLDGQGPYYDELHQATGAFTWTGSPPTMFCRVHLGQWCLFNMPYSGAIKTNLYGLYLRLTGAGFELRTWRLLGIGLLAMGLVGFGALASATLRPGAMAVACLFTALDTSLIVMSRFDWGPGALSAALRFLLLGAWLSTRPKEARAYGACFWVGFLAGLAATEKLSALVLVPVAVLLVALDTPPDARRRSVAAVAFGLSIGLLPLVALNAYSLLAKGGLFSLTEAARPTPRSWSALRVFLLEYLKLGQGGAPRGFTVGTSADERLGMIEAALTIGLSAAIISTAVAAGSPSFGALRRAGTCVLAYWLIGFELFLLPARTLFHHWILGTPFQYVGTALWLQGLRSRRSATGRGSVLAAGATAIVVLWLATRVPTVVQTVADLRAGAAASGFDPSFAALGEFAARETDRAIFIASDWGVGTQLYCYTGGDTRAVDELFWDYHGPDSIERVWRESGKPELYLVRLDPASSLREDATRQIEVDALADRRWRQIPVPHEIEGLSRVRVMRFVRRDSGGDP